MRGARSQRDQQKVKTDGECSPHYRTRFEPSSLESNGISRRGEHCPSVPDRRRNNRNNGKEECLQWAPTLINGKPFDADRTYQVVGPYLSMSSSSYAAHGPAV